MRASLFVLAVILAVALADAQHYVPRSYYTIDAEGHVSAPVMLRRLKRSVLPYPLSADYPRGPGTDNLDHKQTKGSGGRVKTHLRSLIGSGTWEQPVGAGRSDWGRH